MDLLMFIDETDIPLKVEKKKYNKIAITDICICGTKMRATKENGIRKYICDDCGRFITTRETFDNKIEDFTDLERTTPIYGNKSGELYFKKIKEDLKYEINKITLKFAISQEQIMNIMEKFLTIRAERIPRAKPRKGLICACIYEETKIPQEQLCIIYEIKQKYITDGVKMLAHEILPFNNISIESIIEDIYTNLKLQNANLIIEKILIENKYILIELCKISTIFYIGANTTIKTKFSGAVLYLNEAKKINIDFEIFIKLINISRNTVLKYYDQLILALHIIKRKDDQYNESIANRRTQLHEYLKYRNINIVDIHFRGKYMKYMKTYVF